MVHVSDRVFLVLGQEISSLVRDVRAESSEAEAIALVAVAEGEEPMHPDNQSERAEAVSVLQVHVESSEAAAQVSKHTFPAHAEARRANLSGSLLSDGVLGWRPSPGADVFRTRCR